MKKINRILTLLLAAVTALSVCAPALAASDEVKEKYNYNFESDPLGIFRSENRGYASAEIAAIAAEYPDEDEAYLVELARVRIITIVIRSGNWFDLQAGPDYPHGNGDIKPAAEKKTVKDYTDVAPEAWYYDAVMEVSKGKLIVGADSGEFHPDNKVTVAEFAETLCHIYNLPVHLIGGQPDMQYIDAVVAAGLDFGSCNYLQAKQEITRGEAIEAMAVMVRALGREPVRSLDWNDVQDADECWNAPEKHNWDAIALLDALNYGVISGTNAAHRVNAADSLSRAELCKLLQNVGATSIKSVDAYRANEIFRGYNGR